MFIGSRLKLNQSRHRKPNSNQAHYVYWWLVPTYQTIRGLTRLNWKWIERESCASKKIKILCLLISPNTKFKKANLKNNALIGDQKFTTKNAGYSRVFFSRVYKKRSYKESIETRLKPHAIAAFSKNATIANLKRS